MSQIACPDPEKLSAYFRQELPADELRSIAAHLEHCVGCRTIVATLQRDRPEMPSHTVPPADDDTSQPPAQGEPPVESAVSLGELGEYRLLAKLGEGGMGAVYKALHTRLDKIVALKMLPPQQEANDWAVNRFEREMKAIGRLNHPNVIQAYDARQIGSTRFLVTEYVDGIDLGKLLRRYGPLPIAEVCEMARQAALGLQAAHELGLVHRDVKPSNLMLTHQGQVKLLDLGLARLHAGPSPAGELTSSGQIMGTADYMAPEQVSDCHRVDIRADIYSLGCTIYRLLTGEVLFSGAAYQTPFEKMSAHVLKAPPSLRKARSDVPEALATVVHRMLAKQPADRYSTPADVAAALAPFAAGSNLRQLLEPEEAPPGADLAMDNRPRQFALPPGQETRLRGRRWAAIMLVLGGILLGAAIWQATVGFGPHKPIIPPEEVDVKASTGGGGGQPRLSRNNQPPASLVLGNKTRPARKKQPPKTVARLLPNGTPAPAVAPFDPDQALAYRELWSKHLGIPIEQTNSIGMKLLLIPPGEFTMGSDEEELSEARLEFISETPGHRVAITRPFLLGAFEVTQAEYQKVMGGNPSHFSASGEGRQLLSADSTERWPVESVSRASAEEFCRKLSALQAEYSARRVYHLPTEAEWEYACRAGSTTYRFYGDDPAELDQYAWFSVTTPQPVGQKKPNAWGLYDTLGNVFEWCTDWFGRDYYQTSPKEDPVGPALGVEYVIRGGSWWNTSAHCRCAVRTGSPREGGRQIGFRVLCEVSALPVLYRSAPGEQGTKPTVP